MEPPPHLVHQHGVFSAPEHRRAVLSLDAEAESQEHRRHASLQRQRNARTDVAARARKLLLHDEDSLPAVPPPSLSSSPSPAAAPPIATHAAVSMDIGKSDLQNEEFYASQFMNPEPLIEVPADLETKWLLTAAPAGQRCLVISARGYTIARLTNGRRLLRFTSALPGGSGEKGKKRTENSYCILECVYVEATQTFYILDLLAWAGIHYWETEAEFRFFWIQQKLAETTATQRSALNSYVFCALPIAPATRQAIVAAAQAQLPYTLSHLLFYHREAHYAPGSTPLVVTADPRVPHPALVAHLGLPVAPR